MVTVSGAHSANPGVPPFPAAFAAAAWRDASISLASSTVVSYGMERTRPRGSMARPALSSSLPPPPSDTSSPETTPEPPARLESQTRLRR